MHILITGGSGFLGARLARTLLARGSVSRGGAAAHVITRITLADRAPPPADLAADARVQFVGGDLNEQLASGQIPAADTAVVFHLAAAVGVKLIVERPVHTIECNVHGTEVVLRHASKKRKLVLVASTSEVYGKSVHVPFREDADLVLGATTRHRWAYACSKMLDEFHALAYYKEKKLPAIVFRLFNTGASFELGDISIDTFSVPMPSMPHSILSPG